MKAIVELQGKQLEIAEGEEILVDRLSHSAGDSFELDKVLMIVDGVDSIVGKPYVDKAKVKAEVIKHERGDKIDILKYKSKVNHHIRQGHRQELTRVKIGKISK